MDCGCKPIPLKAVFTCKDGVLSLNVAEFIAAYPEFNKLPEPAISAAGDIAIDMLSLLMFGRRYALAVSLLTAHRLAVTYNIEAGLTDAGKQESIGTAVTTNIAASSSSLSQGSTPLAFAVGDDPFNAELARTGYGLQLLELIQLFVSPGELVQGKRIGYEVGAAIWPPPNAGY